MRCSPRQAWRWTPSSSSPLTRTRLSNGCCKRAEIEGRADDTEEVIRRRLEVYGEQTVPLTDVYVLRAGVAQVRQRHGRGRRSDRPVGQGPGGLICRFSWGLSIVLGRDRIQYKTDEQIRLMRRAGLVVADALDAVQAAMRPGLTTERAGRGRLGRHPLGRGDAVLLELRAPALPGDDVHLGERRGRARHPGWAGSRCPVTSSRSTVARF